MCVSVIRHCRLQCHSKRHGRLSQIPGIVTSAIMIIELLFFLTHGPLSTKPTKTLKSLLFLID